MYKEKWMRFTWDLKKLPDTFKSKFPRALKLEKVGPTELKEAWECIQLAYASDQRWSVGLEDTLEELKSVVFKDPNNKRVQCLALRDGGRIVAANVLFPVNGSWTQFLTGTCVIEEYQWRGVGATMLHESLKYLKELGFEEASAVTKENVIAGKYLYKKFNSRIEDLPGKPSVEDLIRVEAEAVPAEAGSPSENANV